MSDIWYALQDHERYVYHYTNAEALTKRILAGDRFLFSTFERLSDPRESKDWSFNFTNYDDNLGASIDAIRAAYNDRLKRTWRLGCFTVDDEEAETGNSGFDPVRALWHRGHSRPRMWAQYGNNYAGACLVFDRQRLELAVRAAATPDAAVHSGTITYEIDPFAGRPFAAGNPHTIDANSVRVLGANAAATEHIKVHYELLYFRKALDWASEKEFRWAVSSTATGDFFVDVGGCLLGILLGDKFPDDLRPAVGEYALSHDTSVAIMDWRNNGIPQPLPTHARLLIGSSKAGFLSHVIGRLRHIPCSLCKILGGPDAK